MGMLGICLLVGCGPTSAGHESAERLESVSGSPSTWNPSSWEPTEVIIPVLTTEAEKERAYREQVARHDQGAGMPAPPQVERSGWYATSLESDRMVSTCLAEAGWPNSVGPTGGI